MANSMSNHPENSKIAPPQQTIFLIQIMFNRYEIIIEKIFFIDAVLHWDIDLAMKKQKNHR